MTGFPIALALGALGGAPDAGAPSIAAGRMVELRAMPNIGRPLEAGVAGPGTAYALAAAADGDGRWREAANQYRVAASSQSGVTPVRDKAQQESQRSLVLETLVQARAPGGDARAPGFVLERARLFRLKLMTVRAATGALSPLIYRGARDGFREALRGLRERHLPGEAEAHLLLAATLAVGGERSEARLELAHVRQVDREDPQNSLAMATCLAALDEPALALDRLEVAVRREQGSARDIYLRNDWDKLRGEPRFERLFGR